MNFHSNLRLFFSPSNSAYKLLKEYHSSNSSILSLDDLQKYIENDPITSFSIKTECLIPDVKKMIPGGLKARQVAVNIIDKHDTNLFRNSSLLHDSNCESLTDISFINSDLERDILFFGAKSFLTLFDISTCFGKVLPKLTADLTAASSFTLVISDISELCLLFDLLDFSSLRDLLVANQCALNLVFAESSKILIHKLSKLLISDLPTLLYRLRVVRSRDMSVELLECYSYLTDSNKCIRDLTLDLGTSSDELNQLFHAIYTSCNSDVHYLKCDDLQTPLYQSVIIVGGGPSLDSFLPVIKEYSDSGYSIVAAGSSLGSLLAHGINVTAVVLLERGSSVYSSCLSLLDLGYKLDSISLISSITADPRLESLFKETIYFHRPCSTVSNFFVGDAEYSSLFVSGPEAVNAAVEVLINLGFQSIFAFGCDFGSPSAEIYRASNAMGESPRKMLVPKRANNYKTIYSDSTLLTSHFSLDAVLGFKSNIKFHRIGLGVPLINSYSDTPGIPEDIITDIEFYESTLFSSLLSARSFRSSFTPSVISVRIDEFSTALNQLTPNIFSLFDSNTLWNISSHRCISSILEQVVITPQFNPDYCSKLMLRSVVFSLFAYYYGVTSIDSRSSALRTDLEISLEHLCDFIVLSLSRLTLMIDERKKWSPDVFIEYFDNVL